MGALFGLALWLCGWVLAHTIDAERSPGENPMFWVLSSAPFWFGGLGWLAGDRRSELQSTVSELRLAAEDSLRELSRREFIARTALQSSYDAVLLLNLDGFVVEASDSAAALFGYSLENLSGMRIEALMPDHDRLDKTGVTQRRSPLGDRLVFEWQSRGRHSDGSVFAVDLHVVLLAEQSLQIFLIREASARIGREERLVRDASESHKDRWVLEQRRRSFVVQVLGDAMRSEARKQLEHIDALESHTPEPLLRALNDSAYRMFERLDQLWDLAMWERTEARPTVGQIELKPLLERVLSDTEASARRSGVSLRAEVRDGAEEIVGDPQLLVCALRNLVLHTLRRVSGGTVRIEVSREAGRGTDWVAMYVEDDSPRMSEEEYERVQSCFDLSAEPSPPPDARAGLALSNRLARSLGGHVSVHPTESGNVLCLRLPLDPSKVKSVPVRVRPRMDSELPQERAEG